MWRFTALLRRFTAVLRRFTTVHVGAAVGAARARGAQALGVNSAPAVWMTVPGQGASECAAPVLCIGAPRMDVSRRAGRAWAIL